MVRINIEKKDLWILVAAVVFVVGVGVVVAYGGSNPSEMGHSFEEIELPSCTEGQVLKMTGGVWNCGNDGTGDTVLSGTWCGISIPAFGALILCQGNDPFVSCPSGYTSIYAFNHGSLNTPLYTCMKT